MNTDNYSVKQRARQAVDSMVGDLKKAAGNLTTPLEAEVTTLEKAADNQLSRDSRTIAGVHEAIAKARRFFGRVYNMDPNFNDVFWTSPEGQLIAEAARWLYGEDLIDLTAAALILFDLPDRKGIAKSDLMRINSMIKGADPALTLFVLPGMPVSRGKRVPRAEVETLKRRFSASETR